MSELVDDILSRIADLYHEYRGPNTEDTQDDAEDDDSKAFSVTKRYR